MVRQINRDIIRHTLMNQNSASIAELARLTGLSTATCANILPELVKSGEVIQLKQLQSQGGRPARFYAYNPDHALIIALLLNCHSQKIQIHYSLRNTMGTTFLQAIETHPDFSLSLLDAVLAKLIQQYPAIKVAAIAIPGVKTHAGKVEICDIPELVGVDLETHIREQHQLDTVAENDMNFAAMGYQSQHQETIASGLAYVVIPGDKCPGCGIVLGGTLIKGKSNFAGELSYLPWGHNENRKYTVNSEVETIEIASRLCCALAAVINPGAVVLTGAPLRGSMQPLIHKRCQDFVPQQHLPAITIQPDYQEDCFTGMVAMARNCLSCKIKIVSRQA